MLRRLLLAGLTLLVLAELSNWQARSSAQPPVRHDTDAVRRHVELHVRYAEARLRLAETRLLKAERLNAIFPRQVAETELRRLRSRVDVLRDQVADTGERPHGYAFVAQRRAAEAAVAVAERELAAAVAVQHRQPEAFAPLDVRLAESQLEIARLRAEIWRDPTFLGSPTEVLQMQIDQLADQMHDLVQRVEASSTIDRR
jgi:hypothetical protein